LGVIYMGNRRIPLFFCCHVLYLYSSMILYARYPPTSGLPQWIVSRRVKRVEMSEFGHPLGGGALFGLGMIIELKPLHSNASFVVAQLRLKSILWKAM
jgi:hypothetical protein